MRRILAAALSGVLLSSLAVLAMIHYTKPVRPVRRADLLRNLADPNLDLIQFHETMNQLQRSTDYVSPQELASLCLNDKLDLERRDRLAYELIRRHYAVHTDFVAFVREYKLEPVLRGRIHVDPFVVAEYTGDTKDKRQAFMVTFRGLTPTGNIQIYFLSLTMVVSLPATSDEVVDAVGLLQMPSATSRPLIVEELWSSGHGDVYKDGKSIYSWTTDAE